MFVYRSKERRPHATAGTPSIGRRRRKTSVKKRQTRRRLQAVSGLTDALAQS